MSVKDGTRFILSDASLESTFNPTLNAESGQVDPDKTVGLLQARGESSLADFKKHASGEGLTRAASSAFHPSYAVKVGGVVSVREGTGLSLDIARMPLRHWAARSQFFGCFMSSPPTSCLRMLRVSK